MADEQQKGAYTDEIRSRMARERQQTYAERFMKRAHPSEVALANFDITRFKDMTEKEQQTMLITLRRGTNLELFFAIAAAVASFGLGALVQSFFPYNWVRVPVIPTLIGSAAVITSLGINRSAGVRYALGVAGTSFALGGSTVKGDT